MISPEYEERRRRGVVVAIRHRHHLYETALAYAREGLLDAFVTQRYCTDRKRVPWLYPYGGRVGSYADKMLAYSKAELNPFVEVHCPRIRDYAISRIFGNRIMRSSKTWEIAVADRCREKRSIPHLACSQAFGIFEALKTEGVPLILEQYIGNRALGRKLLWEEFERLGVQANEREAYLRGFTDEVIDANAAELEMATHIVTGSDFVTSTLIEAGVSQEKVITTYYGADSTFLNTRPPNNAKKGVFRIAFVGNDFVRKGLKYLLEAVSLLRTMEVRVDVFGKGDPDAPYLRALRQHAVFHGSLGRTQLCRELQGCDIACLPSLWEGSALATHECSACGLPGIYTPNTGSMIHDGVSGFLVPIRSAESIAEGITKLLDNRVREEFSYAAQQTAKQCTWDRYRNLLICGLRSKKAI